MKRKNNPIQIMNAENYSMKAVCKYRDHLHRGKEHWTNTRDLLNQSNYSTFTNSHELIWQPVIELICLLVRHCDGLEVSLLHMLVFMSRHLRLTCGCTEVDKENTTGEVVWQGQNIECSTKCPGVSKVNDKRKVRWKNRWQRNNVEDINKAIRTGI